MHHHFSSIVLHPIVFVVIHVLATTTTFSTPWRAITYLVCLLKECSEVISSRLIVPCFLLSYVVQLLDHILEDRVRLSTLL